MSSQMCQLANQELAFGSGAVRCSCDAELCVHAKTIDSRGWGFTWAVDMLCDGVAFRGVPPPSPHYGF